MTARPRGGHTPPRSPRLGRSVLLVGRSDPRLAAVVVEEADAGGREFRMEAAYCAVKGLDGEVEAEAHRGAHHVGENVDGEGHSGREPVGIPGGRCRGGEVGGKGR